MLILLHSGGILWQLNYAFISLQTKAYREYLSERKDINLLTEEDKFLLQLSRVERLQTKLAIMSYMGNFLDNVHLIAPVKFFILLGKEILLRSNQFFFAISASTRHYICIEFGKEFEKITESSRNCAGIW